MLSSFKSPSLISSSDFMQENHVIFTLCNFFFDKITLRVNIIPPLDFPMTINTSETSTKTSRTRIIFDLEDVLTREELLQFKASADAAQAANLTEHLLNVTLRIEKEEPA